MTQHVAFWIVPLAVHAMACAADMPAEEGDDGADLADIDVMGEPGLGTGQDVSFMYELASLTFNLKNNARQPIITETCDYFWDMFGRHRSDGFEVFNLPDLTSYDAIKIIVRGVGPMAACANGPDYQNCGLRMMVNTDRPFWTVISGGPDDSSWKTLRKLAVGSEESFVTKSPVESFDYFVRFIGARAKPPNGDCDFGFLN